MATSASITTYQLIARAFTTDVSYAITITGTTTGKVTAKVNVYFIKPGKPIPAAKAYPVTSGLMLDTYLPDTAYLAWVDLLRMEKPLSFLINGTSFYIQSGQEPAGAHELGL